MNNVTKIDKHPKYHGFNYPPQVIDTKLSVALEHDCGSVNFNVKLAPSGAVELWCAKCNEKLEIKLMQVGENRVAANEPETPEAA